MGGERRWKDLLKWGLGGLYASDWGYISEGFTRSVMGYPRVVFYARIYVFYSLYRPKVGVALSLCLART